MPVFAIIGFEPDSQTLLDIRLGQVELSQVEFFFLHNCFAVTL